ncbi:UNVERIFIED_CONTAM: hypothetical protein HDU68_012410, partial [Siphonaria sp. JEL0065]
DPFDEYVSEFLVFSSPARDEQSVATPPKQKHNSGTRLASPKKEREVTVLQEEDDEKTVLDAVELLEDCSVEVLDVNESESDGGCELVSIEQLVRDAEEVMDDEESDPAATCLPPILSVNPKELDLHTPPVTAPGTRTVSPLTVDDLATRNSSRQNTNSNGEAMSEEGTSSSIGNNTRSSNEKSIPLSELPHIVMPSITESPFGIATGRMNSPIYSSSSGNANMPLVSLSSTSTTPSVVVVRPIPKRASRTGSDAYIPAPIRANTSTETTAATSSYQNQRREVTMNTQTKGGLRTRLQTLIDETDEENTNPEQQRDQRKPSMTPLLAVLSSKGSVTKRKGKREDTPFAQAAPPQTPASAQLDESKIVARCLICQKPYLSRNGLRYHMKTQHVDE